MAAPVVAPVTNVTNGSTPQVTFVTRAAVTEPVTRSDKSLDKKPVTKIVGKPIVTNSTSYAHSIVGKDKSLVTTDARRGWIEYNKSGHKRYPRRRWWLRHNGKWVKNKKPPRLKNYGPFTEDEYQAIKEMDERIKEAEYRDR